MQRLFSLGCWNALCARADKAQAAVWGSSSARHDPALAQRLILQLPMTRWTELVRDAEAALAPLGPDTEITEVSRACAEVLQSIRAWDGPLVAPSDGAESLEAARLFFRLASVNAALANEQLLATDERVSLEACAAHRRCSLALAELDQLLSPERAANARNPIW